jgi:cell wall-associated NlpC family hydrolase
MELYEAARQFLDTPFKHQGRYLHGVDCAGLVILSAKMIGQEIVDVEGYHRMPDDKALTLAMDSQLTKVHRAPEVNDIVLMAIGKNAQHIGIITPNGLIHAYEGAGKVVEHNFDARWSSRVKGVYTL